MEFLDKIWEKFQQLSPSQKMVATIAFVALLATGILKPDLLASLKPALPGDATSTEDKKTTEDKKALTIKLLVRNEVSQEPLAGVKVELINLGPTVTDITDSDGNVNLRLPEVNAADEVELRLIKQGFKVYIRKLNIQTDLIENDKVIYNLQPLKSGVDIQVIPLVTPSLLVPSPYVVMPHFKKPNDLYLTRKIRSIRNYQDLLELLKSNGGVFGSIQSIQIAIHNSGNSPVVVSSIEADIIERRPPLKGWFVTDHWGCGGGELISPHIAHIDLDSESTPRAVFDEGNSNSRVPKSLLMIAKGDLAIVELYASTRKSYLRWKPRITYSTSSKSTTVDVYDSDKKAFEVTSETKSKSYRVEGGKLIRKPGWDYGIILCASESKLMAKINQ